MSVTRDRLEASLALGREELAACPRWRWRKRRAHERYIAFCEQLLSRYTG
jgi:hypothetical protein